MTATETDLAALLAAVEAAPADDAPKLVLADWLQKRSAHPDAEAAVRWCVRAGRWPLISLSGMAGDRRWWWKLPEWECSPHSLPKEVDRLLLGSSWFSLDLLALLAATGRALAAAGHLGGPCDLLGTEAPGF